MKWGLLSGGGLAIFLAVVGLADYLPDDIPVRPVPATERQGWTNAFVLKNARLEVVIAPSAGRVMEITPTDGVNFLRVDEASQGLLPPADREDQWLNYGGDWIWPTSQTNWTAIAGRNWPPPRLIDGRPWSGRAWETADGTLCCLMTLAVGPPLNIQVSRTVKLPKDAATFSIRQRIEQLEETVIPVTLWNVSQVAGAEEVLLATDDDSRFEGGYRRMGFEAIDEDAISPCDGALRYVPGKGEHKVCSDAESSWIAARKGSHWLIEQAVQGPEGTQPDGGCTLEMYSNAGLGYTELETLSVEKVLKPGESLANELVFHVLAGEEGADACATVKTIEQLLNPPDLTIKSLMNKGTLERLKVPIGDYKPLRD